MSTTAERKFKRLNAKKESLFLIIQNLYDLTKNISQQSQREKFELLYSSLESTRDSLIIVIDEINDIGFDIKDDFIPDYQILSTINEMCCHIQVAAAKIKATRANPSDSTPVDPNRVLPSLPKIELPEFSGEIRQWETFYAIYKSLIHDNPTLNKTEKVHYLIGRLRGSALSMCSGIAPTGDNYDIIWQSLLDRYQDKRYLANNYLDQIMNFKSLNVESAKNLNLFLERFDVAVSALKKLNLPDLSDFILFYLARNKLDIETVKTFDSFKRSSSIPTYTDLVTFVKEQSKLLNLNKSTSSLASSPRNTKFFSGQVRGDGKIKPTLCVFCKKGGHYLGRCEKFKALTPSKRYETVKNNNWCYNCLSPKHGVRSCPTGRTCLECSKKHHILLHMGKPVREKICEDEEAVSLESPTDGQQSLCSTISKNCNLNCSSTVLLSTAVVYVLNSPVLNATARFILDTGSQVNLLTVKCCKKLGLNISKTYSSVQGLGESSQKVKGKTELVIGSRYNKENIYNISAFLVEKITDKLPKLPVDSKFLPEWKNIDLADMRYSEPGEIDGIIGAELFPYIFGKSRITRDDCSPVAMETAFGYVIMGQVPNVVQTAQLTFLTQQDDSCVEELLNKFWELEQVPQRSIFNPEELKCEDIFLKTYSRDKVTGKFCVALPFKHNPKNLGDSKRNAQFRLLSLEKRLNKFPNLRFEYNKAMSDFIDQGHMQILRNDSADDLSYYIPHHAVVKLESSSTPLRVVLDASAPSDSDVSLNDILYNGPKLQADIFTLLLNFRLFKIAMTADIRQMYRQINIVKEHWPFQRLLWRFDPKDQLETYELTVVAFGVKSSPYLALRVIQQLVEDEKEKYPLAASFISRDLYMDDLVSSIPSEDQAHQLYQESVQLFTAGAFELTKFSTNSRKLLNKIPVNKRLSKDVTFKSDTKILGMRWNPELDILSFKLDVPNEKCTKRTLLSSVARCYDPIGLISPFIFFLKLLVKQLWKLKIDWDAEPPENVRNIWKNVRLEWNEIYKLEFPRHLGVTEDTPVTILAFADASQDGYGAVVYSKVLNEEGAAIIRLVCAKSKVSPFKLVTIPRLELCAALLLSNLVRHIIHTYANRIVIAKIFAFSDSSTVLNWLNSPFVKDVFVANRVSQIKENIPDAQWRHIEGIGNPADCLSRGLTPRQLINHPLWVSGPEWMQFSEMDWPVKQIGFSSMQVSDVFKDVFIMTNEEKNHPLLELAEKCSSWLKILRITVWVLRFLKLLPVKGFIAVTDLHRAETTLIKLVQAKYFDSDIRLLMAGKRCSTKLWKLKPFLHNGLLRVGGRLTNSSLSFFQKHPMILPAKDPLVALLVDFNHLINLHTGPYLLEAILRQKYWILGGRNLIRSRVHKCNKCFRMKPLNLTPRMADLPTQRVSQTKPFLHTGVDYFGPISLTLGKRRGSQVYKAYGCLFVCMSVKAVHLELVSSLSTAHFLQAFKRFLSRRGPCQVMYSDHGTNFVGAKKVLREINNLVNSVEYKDMILSELARDGIEWRFNTPYGPHQGGLWESNVKAVKNHLYRVIGDQLLTYEEMATLFTQIEALLNSRPLCRLSSDALAPDALTPAHFLTLVPLRGLPTEDLSDVRINRLDRFQLIDRMVQDFWKRWRLEYLTSLQIREKWTENSPSVKVGTVVVLKSDNSPPLHWPLARIINVHPGKDGVVRTVTVKTSKGIFVRPVVKICPLPSQ